MRRGIPGAKTYEPRLMVVLLLYAYCVGMPSSRRIERACCPQLINQRHHQGSDRWRHRRRVAIGNSSSSGRVISDYLMLREALVRALSRATPARAATPVNGYVEPVFGSMTMAMSRRMTRKIGLERTEAPWASKIQLSTYLDIYSALLSSQRLHKT